MPKSWSSIKGAAEGYSGGGYSKTVDCQRCCAPYSQLGRAQDRLSLKQQTQSTALNDLI